MTITNQYTEHKADTVTVAKTEPDQFDIGD